MGEILKFLTSPSDKTLDERSLELGKAIMGMGGIVEQKVKPEKPAPNQEKVSNQKINFPMISTMSLKQQPPSFSSSQQKPQAQAKPQAKTQTKSQKSQQPVEKPSQAQVQAEAEKSPYEILLQTINQTSEKINQQIDEINKKRQEILDRTKTLLIDYKDKMKELLGLHLTILSKTALNQYIDHDYSLRLGELIEALPPEALGEGIKLFQTGYVAGKFAGIDLRDKSLSEIMSYGENPEIITKMPNKMLELIDTLNNYLPQIYNQELEVYKLQLQQLDEEFEKVKTQIQLLEQQRKAIDDWRKWMETLVDIEYKKALTQKSLADIVFKQKKLQLEAEKLRQKQQAPATAQSDATRLLLEALKGAK